MAQELIRSYSEQLHDKDKKTRAHACEQLGALGSAVPAPAVRAIEDLLNDKEKTVRSAAAKALGEIRNSDSANALRNAIEAEKDRGVRSEMEASYNLVARGGGAAPASSSAPPREHLETRPTQTEVPSEDALLLHAIEELRGKVDRTGENAIELTKAGSLMVKNLGEDDRIFDIDLKLDNVEGLKLDKEIFVGELEPQGEWKEEYEIKDADVSELPFKFEETINTQPDGEASTVLVYGREMNIDVTLKFDFNREIDNMTIEKVLPGLDDLSVKSVSAGRTDLDGGKLVWELEGINPGDTAECTFTGRTNVEDVEPRPTGPIHLKYSGKGEKTTKLVILGADGYVRCRTYVESDERDEEPDTWDNRLAVDNRSEFPIELREIKVYDDNGVYIERTFEQDEVIILSGDSWNSDPWEVVNADLPHFKKELHYTVKPEAIMEASGDIEIPETELRVAYAKGQRKFSKHQVPSFRETPIDVVSTVCNVGSVGFEELEVREDLPIYFAPPDLDTVEVWVKKEKDKEPKEKLSSSNYSLSIEPPGAEVGERKTLVCKISGVVVEPKNCVVLKYSPVITSPPPDTKFEADPNADALLTEPAPHLEIPIEDDLEQVIVSHIRRKLTWAKDVRPQKDKGVYNISLYFKNRSNAAIEKIVLLDLIPEGFTLTQDADQIQSKVKEKADKGVIREWVIEKLEENEEIELEYTVRGEGEYRGEKLLVSY